MDPLYIDNEEQDYEEMVEFLPERNAYERVGMKEEGDILATFYGKKMSDIFREIRRMNYSDEERFKLIMDISRSQLSNYLSNSITLKDISNIKNSVLENAPNKINYLNPICLILGYYITNSGRTPINMERFNRVVQLLPKLEYITPPDLVRYSRFWNKSI